MTGTEKRRHSDGALDAELAHAGLQRGALDAEKLRGSVGAGDAPLGLPQRAQNVLALRFLQRGRRSRSEDGSRRISKWDNSRGSVSPAPMNSMPSLSLSRETRARPSREMSLSDSPPATLKTRRSCPFEVTAYRARDTPERVAENHTSSPRGFHARPRKLSQNPETVFLLPFKSTIATEPRSSGAIG